MAARRKPTHALRLGLSQLNATVGDLSGNLELVTRALANARTQQCDVVAFPELVLTGYPPEDLLLQPQFVDDAQHSLKTLAPHTRGLVAMVGCVHRSGQQLFNAAAIYADGRLVGCYHKMRLPNYGVFDEQRYFAAGARPMIVSWNDRRIGINICEDLWHADGPVPALAHAGAQLMVNMSASPYHAGKLTERRTLIRRWVTTTRTPLAYVNLVGGQDELVFDGNSIIMDAHGHTIAQAPAFEEGLLMADMTLRASRTRPAHRGSAVEQLRVVTEASASPRTPSTPHRAKPLTLLDEVYQALVLGTRDYVRKNGFEQVVLGLSGGIDSALTAVIAADAVGRENVVGLVMPSTYSSAETQADAVRMAEQLGIQLWRVPIEPLLQAYLTALSSVMPHRAADITEQNLQARIRGTLLMACSNKFGSLLLSTGNKSEIATGYCTLYGDMAGGFAVLKDVPKTLVYQLARFRNDRAPVAPIPERVLLRPPTAELAPHQTDQDTLPPYDVLDPILKSYIEDELPQRAIMRRTGHREAVKHAIQLVDRAEYKRRQGAPGIKITPRAFGKDRRMPITNRYREHYGRTRSELHTANSELNKKQTMKQVRKKVFG